MYDGKSWYYGSPLPGGGPPYGEWRPWGTPPGWQEPPRIEASKFEIPGTWVGADEQAIAEFERAARRIMDLAAQQRVHLSRRDMAMMQIGMRGCHIEEAMARGELDRASHHLGQLVALFRSL